MAKTILDFSKSPEADVVVNYTNKRLKHQHTNIFVIGLPGTGKSSTCIRLAEIIKVSRKERFDIDAEIFLTSSLLEFVRALRQSKEGKAIIIIEEVSVLFGSRRSMAGDNVDVNKIMDTCRKKRITIISNAPIWGGIDSYMRGMGNLIIETLKINLTHKVVISKFHRLQTNPASGKTYRHTMQRSGRDVSRMFTQMPSKDLWDKYEEDKDKFMDELYKQIEYQQVKKIKKLEKETEVVKPDINQLTKKELMVHKLFSVEGLTQAETARRMNVSDSWVNQLRDKIKKKCKIPLENTVIKVEKRGTPPIK